MLRSDHRLRASRYAFIALVAVLSGAPAHAQSYTILHSFGAAPLNTGSPQAGNTGSGGVGGLNPTAGLVRGTDGNYYGTTTAGGASAAQGIGGSGTIYSISPSGALVLLHSFGDGSVQNDGVNPASGLLLGSDGALYGTTERGGASNEGTVYKADLPAGKIALLHSFGDSAIPADGQGPVGSLVLANDGNMYGTTGSGGTDFGTVFRITPAGVLSILHKFNSRSVANDGQYPSAGLVQGADGNLYGTTAFGGAGKSGTVFRMTLDGDVTILHSFSDGTLANDGYYPTSALVQGDDGNFYGTTPYGGAYKDGTAFMMTPNGALSILHSFGDPSVASDGRHPQAPMIVGNDGTFYGTTSAGGNANQGVVFQMTKSGTVTILHSFAGGSNYADGIDPLAPLVMDDAGGLYGTTFAGGSTAGQTIGGGDGVVFEVKTAAAVATAYHKSYWAAGAALVGMVLILAGLAAYRARRRRLRSGA